MSTPTLNNRVIVLFDEFGNPTFRPDRHSDSFLGVSVVYQLEAENHIFEQCDVIFGLSNLAPVKNDRIGTSRAEGISELICSLPIQVTISSIDLSNTNLQRVVNLYEDFGAELRRLHRGVSPRLTAHILHDNILDDTLFEAMGRYLGEEPVATEFEISIDDWPIPSSDIDIALQYRSASFTQKLSEIYEELGIPVTLSVSPIQRMSQDSKRKRFIDVTTSAVSRHFFPQDHRKYSPTPLRNILGIGHNRYAELTERTIEFLRGAMDAFSRNPGPKSSDGY